MNKIKLRPAITVVAKLNRLRHPRLTGVPFVKARVRNRSGDMYTDEAAESMTCCVPCILVCLSILPSSIASNTGAKASVAFLVFSICILKRGFPLFPQTTPTSTDPRFLGPQSTRICTVIRGEPWRVRRRDFLPANNSPELQGRGVSLTPLQAYPVLLVSKQTPMVMGIGGTKVTLTLQHTKDKAKNKPKELEIGSMAISSHTGPSKARRQFTLHVSPYLLKSRPTRTV